MATQDRTARASTRRAAMWGALTLLGILLYVILDIIAQLLPPHFSPVTQAESDLAVGPYGWIMAINFVVRGALSLCLLLGLRAGLAPQARSRAGMACFSVWAVGAILLALFPTDVGARHTLHGLIHLLVALLAFLGGAVGALLISSRLGADPRWAARPILLAVALTAVLVLVGYVPATRFAGGVLFGLIERVFLGLVLLWEAVAAACLVRFNQALATG